jgi:hypothetical protein
MGQKYSTVYQHNTQSNYQTHNYDTNTVNNLEDITNIKSQLGEDCKLFNKYPGRLKCKLCYESMYLEPVMMLYCGHFRHRYHIVCMEAFIKFADRRDVFKCEGCREVLSKESDLQLG